MELQVQLLHSSAKVPQRAYDSAGYDLFPLTEGTIWPGKRANIKLGFATAFTPGYVGVIDDRGSTGNKGLMHLAGVIDADYRGEWQIIMHNTGAETYSYNPEKAIAQVLFLKVEAPVIEQTQTLSETVRGEGKFGSSGH